MKTLARHLVSKLIWPSTPMEIQPAIVHSWASIVQLAGVKPKTSQYLKYINTIEQHRLELPHNEDDFISNHPARSKSDLSIRRCRYTDIYKFIKLKINSDHDNKQINILHIEEIIGFKYDYITTCNLLLAYIMFGQKWFHRWHSVCCFGTDIENMTTIMDKISNTIKKIGCNLDDWQLMLENKCLTGYRQLPFPGFNMNAECIELASAGTEHVWSENKTLFENAARELLLSEVKIDTKPKLNFKDYISSNMWARSGSSSIGKLTLTIEGKDQKTKISKAQVLDIFGIDELYEMCMTSKKQLNIAFDKPELGKIRVAVSSDLLTYLKMSYIYYCSGKFYNEWQGVTASEDIYEESDRMINMLRILKTWWSLPFDYRAFDHQPTTYELAFLNSLASEIGIHNAPNVTEFNYLTQNINESWYESFLLYHYNDTPIELRVKGHLMSGLFPTAILGNAWNKFVTSLNLEICAIILEKTNPTHVFIKGDDSSILAAEAQFLQSVELTYRAMGIIGGIGKFSIIQSNTEFLRVWFKKRCFGYPARALPGLMQAKPWSNTPWQPASAMSAVVEVGMILIRRGISKNLVHDFVYTALKSWCNSVHLPEALLKIPKSIGGLGMLPWDGETYVKPKLPTLSQITSVAFTLPNLTFVNRSQRISNLATQWRIDPPAAEISNLSKKQFAATLASDNLPKIRMSLHLSWKKLINSTNFTIFKKYNNYKIPVDPVLSQPLCAIGALKDWNMENKQNTSYASCSYEVSVLDQLQPLITASGLTLKQFIEQTPELLKLKNALQVTKGHLTEILNWLGGRIHPVTTILNSKLAPVFLVSLIRNLSIGVKRSYLSTLISSYIWPMYANTYYLNTDISLAVFMY